MMLCPSYGSRIALNVATKCFVSRRYFVSKKSIILGIETSCDDTGCAVIDTDGNILGEALKSQHLIHLK